MMTIWRQADKVLLPIEKSEPDCWINITQPNNYEISCLINEYGLEADILNDILDIDEQARVEKDGDKIFFIVRIPVFQEDRETPYFTVPLGIIFFKDMIMTICLQESDILRDMLAGRIRHFALDNRKTFLLTVFNRVSFYFLRYLKEINRRSAQTEKELQRAVRNTELIQLLILEKSLVFFTTSLKSNEFLIEKIQKPNLLRLSEEEADLIDEVVTENRQAIEMANIYSNILSGMMDAFASVISNNLNVVMKQLTSISLILMLPTLIASIYGMNVVLPFQDHPFAFAGTLAVSGALAIISIIIFRRKRFF
ncbi:MAG: magnesium transporter CorA family protein [Spirochaetales bacterium]|jgi:magnesium transporter|nr:magnesium transporter CorA family protein [Spirochaetales bacterium]